MRMAGAHLKANMRSRWLEPISKSSEEDDEASELHEAKEVLGIELPAHEKAALPLNPGEEPLDQTAPRILRVFSSQTEMGLLKTTSATSIDWVLISALKAEVFWPGPSLRPPQE